jgi:hypothetical protein
VSITGQPYGYANEDPTNQSDPTGMGCGIFGVVCDTATQAWNDTGGQAVSAVGQHWHGSAQVATVAGSGLASAVCIAATEGLCALALPEIGAVTSVAVYAEGGGQHTARGYVLAFAEGGVGGSVALVCVAACEAAGGVVIGGALVNGLWGAGQGALDYANNADCHHTPGGYLSAGGNGFAQGAVPWDRIWKAIHPD